MSLSTSVEAYNFTYIHPTTGKPLSWGIKKTITYYLDPGPFGNLTNDQMHTLVKEAMKLWSGVNPNVPRFKFGGFLPEDVDGTNYKKYATIFPCYKETLSECETQAQKDLKTVIIFDDDAKITSGLCRISGCSAIAGPRVFEGNQEKPGNFLQGIFVMNSLFFSVGNSKGSTDEVVGTILHELGHLLGLAHTGTNQQINLEGEDLKHLESTMFSRGNGPDQATLNPDDIAGINVLYPPDTFSKDFGTIKGKITKSDGKPMIDVNVTARNVDDPLCQVYSFITGRSCGVLSASKCLLIKDQLDFGYSINALSPGTYTIEVEELDSDLAFSIAPGLVDPFMSGDAEFWNENDQANESATTSTTITLKAGETRENIDIVLNRSKVTDDRVKYLPLSTFKSGSETQCLKKPIIDYAKLIGVKEFADVPSNVSFGGGCSLIP